MTLFAVEYTYSDTTLPERDEVRPRHRAWLADRVTDGFVVSSGPYADGSGALIIVAADDTATVEQRLVEDPFRVARLVDAVRVTEWNPVLGAFSDR